MTRMKRGVTAHARHKAVLKRTKGFIFGRKSNYRLAKTAAFRAGQNAYRDRRRKKRDFRRLWIIRINAAARMNGLSYSVFMNGLTRLDVLLNRKVLSEMAIHNAEGFAQLATKVKAL